MARPTGFTLGNIARKAQAITRARELAPIIASLLADGVTSNAQLAIALNAKGFVTYRGGAWSGAQVRRVRIWLEEP